MSLQSVLVIHVFQFIFLVNTPCFSAEMDHCADGKHGCEQEFVSGEDSCVCTCRDGFTLRPDGKTCQSESTPLHSQVFSTQLQLHCDIFI